MGETPLDEFEARPGWPQVYTWANFKKFAKDIADRLWSKRATKPTLVVIVPADSPKLTSSYFLTLLHKWESITRKLVYYLKWETDKEKRVMI